MCSLLGVSSCRVCSPVHFLCPPALLLFVLQQGLPPAGGVSQLTLGKVLLVRGTAERCEGSSGGSGGISLPCPSQCLPQGYCLLCGSICFSGVKKKIRGPNWSHCAKAHDFKLILRLIPDLILVSIYSRNIIFIGQSGVIWSEPMK